MQDFQISTKILQDFQILVQILMYWFSISGWCDYLLHTCRLTQCTGRNLHSSIHCIPCMCDTDTMYKEVIGIYMHACRLTTDNIQGAYNVGLSVGHTVSWYTLALELLKTESKVKDGMSLQVWGEETNLLSGFRSSVHTANDCSGKTVLVYRKFVKMCFKASAFVFITMQFR